MPSFKFLKDAVVNGVNYTAGEQESFDDASVVDPLLADGTLEPFNGDAPAALEPAPADPAVEDAAPAAGEGGEPSGDAAPATGTDAE